MGGRFVSGRAAVALLLLACLAAVPRAAALDLGNYGRVWPLAERPFLEWIQQRAKALQPRWRQMMDDARQRYRDRVERPPPTMLPAAPAYRRWLYNPTYVAPETLVDDRGQAVVLAGERVNPLDRVSLPGPLVFFAGDDPRQRSWIRSRADSDNETWIMTSGPYMRLLKEWSRRLYFDQGGELLRKLGIGALPATVRQQGSRLVLEEWPL